MRKLILVFVGAIALSTSNVSAQVVKEGNIIADLYYGWPNLYNKVFLALVTSDGEDNLSSGGIGPVGIRGEYMLADKIGLGFDLAYSNARVKYEVNNYEEKFATTKIGAMVTFNYHFIDNDALDFYGMIGAGYKNRSFKYTSNNPNSVDDFDFGATLIPVAFRLGVGLRYFFTDNIGLNMAVGFGHSGIINGGVSFKF